MADESFIHQEPLQNMDTNHRGVEDGGGIYEPEKHLSYEPERNATNRSKKKGLWYRITHGAPADYLIVIVCFLIIILALIIAVAKKSCNTSAPKTEKNSSITAPTVYLDSKGKKCLYQEIRLPTDIIPIEYNIFLDPNLYSVPKATFIGLVTIVAECVKPRNSIVLHMKDLTITQVSLKGSTSGPFRLGATGDCPNLEHVYIPLDRSCAQGEKLTLKINFTGIMAKRLDGFYLSEYKTKAGATKLLGTTHMEPTSARRAFPCFDEPAFKANFTLSMKRDKNHLTLFNMPKKREIPSSNGVHVIDEYEQSVKMSTYLVAFMILPVDYENISGESPNKKVKIGVYAPSEYKSSTQFALNVTKKVLPFFEDFFSQKYPLPKLDMIAIPDFGAGAMENWGLITYRFVTLLFDPMGGQVQHMQNVAEVISHEIAHQWFGNIVTMGWWNDLWLNEGFATFTQYLGADHFNKDWQMMDQFYLNNFQQAMFFDCLLHSHPIPVPVKDPHEIESIFDDISYFKGASLLRMLESVVGQESLKAGLKIYLNRFKYKNAVSSDLWKAITEGYATEHKGSIPQDSPTKNLRKVMDTWLEQMNYPLVTVTMLNDRTFNLRQERYLLFKNATQIWKAEYESVYNYMWIIPVKYITNADPNWKLVWLNYVRDATFTLDKPAEWIKINYEQTGYYQVNYDEKTWMALIGQLKKNHLVFSASDRAGLINDAFFLVRSGHLKVTIALELVSYLSKETDYAPWYTAFQRLTYFGNMIYADVYLYKKFQKYMLELITPIVTQNPKFSWNAKDLNHMQILTRNAVLLFAIMNGETTTIKAAMDAFKQYKTTKSFSDSNLKNIAYYTGVVEGNEADWEFLWNIYRTTTKANEKRSVRRALAATRNWELMHRLLSYTLNANEIRPQDAVSVINDVAKTPIGRDLAWTFIRRFWKHFHKQYAGQAFLMAELLKVCNWLNTDFDYAAAKKFFDQSDLGSGTRSSLQALEYIKSNIFWKKTHYFDVKDWLDKRYPN